MVVSYVISCEPMRFNIHQSFVTPNHYLLYDTHVSREMAANTTAWASYQIHKIVGGACAGNAGIVFPASAG